MAWLCIVAGLLLPASPVWANGAAQAQLQPAGNIRVHDAWLRAVPPVAKNSAGYLVIENTGAAEDVLVAVQVEGVRVTELHEMVRRGDTMMMQRRPSITVPAKGRAVLAPGGLHLMLIDLQQPVRAGETRKAVLQFRDAGDVAVILGVRTP